MRIFLLILVLLGFLLGLIKAQGINPITPLSNDLIEITKPAFANPSSFYTTPFLLSAGGTPNVKLFSSTDAMLALASTLNPSGAYTFGRDSAGDDGGGAFFYDASDTTSPDNGGTIRVDGAGHRFKWSGQQLVYVELFGGGSGAGNGVVTNNTAFANALSWIKANSTLPPAGLDSCLHLHSKTYIVTLSIDATSSSNAVTGAYGICGTSQINSIIVGALSERYPVLDASGAQRFFLRDLQIYTQAGTLGTAAYLNATVWTQEQSSQPTNWFQGLHNVLLNNYNYAASGNVASAVIQDGDQTVIDGNSVLNGVGSPGLIIGGWLPALDVGIAQGGSANTIRFATTASAVDGAYVGMQFRSYAGAIPASGLNGETHICTAYVGSTRACTVSGNFTSTPTNASGYEIFAINSKFKLIGGQTSGATLYNVFGGNLAGSGGLVYTGSGTFNAFGTYFDTENHTGLYDDAAITVTSQGRPIEPLTINLHGVRAECYNTTAPNTTFLKTMNEINTLSMNGKIGFGSCVSTGLIRAKTADGGLGGSFNTISLDDFYIEGGDWPVFNIDPGVAIVSGNASIRINNTFGTFTNGVTSWTLSNFYQTGPAIPALVPTYTNQTGFSLGQMIYSFPALIAGLPNQKAASVVDYTPISVSSNTTGGGGAQRRFAWTQPANLLNAIPSGNTNVPTAEGYISLTSSSGASTTIDLHFVQGATDTIFTTAVVTAGASTKIRLNVETQGSTILLSFDIIGGMAILANGHSTIVTLDETMPWDIQLFETNAATSNAMGLYFSSWRRGAQ